jgi:hypothetical protein
MKQFKIDLHKNRIEFTDSRFYLSEEGSYIPSVTTILDAYPKDASFYKWLKDVGQDADTIRDEAGRRGSNVHELTEKYDSGEEVSYINNQGWPAFKMLEWSMFERYVEFTEKIKPEIDMMELHMISDKLGFAGTLDRVVSINGKKILLDIKTSNSIQPTHWLQLSAYNELLKEGGAISIDQVAILWLNAKTRTEGKGGVIQGKGWQLITKDISEVEKDWEIFKTTYKLWQAINGDIKPRNLSYKLVYKK